MNKQQTPECYTQFGDYLFDCIALLLICPKHRQIALSTNSLLKSIWFPICPIQIAQGYDEAAMEFVKRSLGKQVYKTPNLISIMRLQVANYFDFITRIVYLVELDNEKMAEDECCVHTNNFSWYSFEQTLDLPNLWGPEPISYLHEYTNREASKLWFNMNEYTIRGIIYTIVGNARDEELLINCGCNQNDVLTLYGEFIQHCYPSQYMTYYSFVTYVTKANLRLETKFDMAALFRAFASNLSYHSITFFEFVMGLAALDKQTLHGGRSGEARVGYIFRYYNSSETPFLTSKDIQRLTEDLMKTKNSNPIDSANIEKEVKNIYQSMGLPDGSPVSGKAFAQAVGSLNIRGTSLLFRMDTSLLIQIASKPYYQSIKNIRYSTVSQNAIGMKRQRLRDTCSQCRQKEYTLAAHFVTILQDGIAVDPREIKGQLDVYRVAKPLRKMSDLSFNAMNPCNTIIDNIRAFNDDPSRSAWANSKYRLSKVADILTLCELAQTLFENECRVIKVTSPVYVFGDIHGNLHDLMIYERIFWRSWPCLSNNYLFLGDYVDRGINSVECALYLICAKILFPARFFLLRGNHELRVVQRQFTFYRECIDKFEMNGDEVSIMLIHIHFNFLHF